MVKGPTVCGFVWTYCCCLLHHTWDTGSSSCGHQVPWEAPIEASVVGGDRICQSRVSRVRFTHCRAGQLEMVCCNMLCNLRGLLNSVLSHGIEDVMGNGWLA